MAKLTIIAAATGSYRRGGLDLSGGKAVTIDEKEVSAAQLKALNDDPRVTVSDAKAVKKSGGKTKPSDAEKNIAKTLKAAKAEAGNLLKAAKTAVTNAGKAGGKNKSEEQVAALAAAKEDLTAAQTVHDEALAAAEAAAAKATADLAS